MTKNSGLSGLSAMTGLSGIVRTANWWIAGGAPTPIAVYQPIGADSLATSYTNLVNPGTYDATPGVAPTWDANDGWIFDGVAQYLTCGLTPSGTWSILIQFTNYVDAESAIFGAIEATSGINMGVNGASTFIYANGATNITGSAHASSGNIAVVSTAGYLDGVSDAVLPGDGAPTHNAYIGARNLLGLSPNGFANVKIQAVAIYDSTLTSAQVLAVATAMAELPWWRAGRAPEPVAVYQPKGADDLANSYVNLVNPGTYDAAPGVAPTWDVVNGWKFNGVNQYLDTIVNYESGWTAIVQFNGAVYSVLACLAGLSVGALEVSMNTASTEAKGFLLMNANFRTPASSIPFASDGNLCIAGPSGYRDGMVLTGGTFLDDFAGAQSMYIGVLNDDGVARWFFEYNVSAFAIYDSILTPAQVLAVANAMAAL